MLKEMSACGELHIDYNSQMMILKPLLECFLLLLSGFWIKEIEIWSPDLLNLHFNKISGVFIHTLKFESTSLDHTSILSFLQGLASSISSHLYIPFHTLVPSHSPNRPRPSLIAASPLLQDTIISPVLSFPLSLHQPGPNHYNLSCTQP